MEAEALQDLECPDFKDGDMLPFEVDPGHGLKCSGAITAVVPNKSYATRFQRSLILKKISLPLPEPGQSINSEAKRLFLQEARALRYARHRHVVGIAMAYSFEGVNEAYFAIVMNRADSDIESYLICRQPSEKRKENIPGWFGCLAKAVAHIHEIGIRHRDIKPANILIKDGSILLADFGISKMGLGKTLSTTIPGLPKASTPKYAAPEVGEGGTRSRAADIFSLGAVFLEMLVALDYDHIRPGLSMAIAAPQPSRVRAAGNHVGAGPSFARQLDRVQNWMKELEGKIKEPWHRKILSLCRDMMKEEREERPLAEDVYSVVSSLSSPGGLLGPCVCKWDDAFTDSQKLLDACKRVDGLTEVKSLLGRTENMKNTIGAIHLASAHGFGDIVEAFLDHGADVNLLDHSKQTALHCAAGYGHEGVVDLLLERSADVTKKNEEEQTPLHCASGNGNLSIVVKLLVADISKKSTVAKDIYEQTALHLAAKRGYEEVVETLISQMEWHDVTLRDGNNRMALHLAAGFGSEEVVEMLLEYAAGYNLVNAVDSRGWTALHFAASGKQDRGKYSGVIQCLLNKGADVNIRDVYSHKALYYAKENKHAERIELLTRAAEQGKDAPGAPLTHPPSAADSRSMEKQLSQIILPHRQYSEDNIRQVSNKLQSFHPGWERLTRVYMVLYTVLYTSDPSDLAMNLQETMDKFIRRKITDYRLPIKGSDLSDILLPGSCARFEKQQQAVLANTLRLEKLGGHCNFRTDEWENRFEKIMEIGQGNSGEVYKVKDKDTGEVYALKLIRRGKEDSERRAGEELNMLSRVKHNNIVSLVGSFTSPAFFGLLIKPVAERDLAEFLLAASSNPDWRSFLPGFFGCLVNALWYLHNVEYVRHNDIKPGNILVRDGRVFLTDFGISLDWSKTGRSTTLDQNPAMTPMYCAPEVTQEDQPRDSFADIWSLGCVFLEIVTVLKGRQIDDIRKHLSQRDPRSIAYGKNIFSIHRWIEILRESVGYINNEPLKWIGDMLQEYPKSRPTASQLRDTLHSTSNTQAPLFGLCCRVKSSALEDVETAHLAEDDGKETFLIEQHTCVAAVAWPGECRLYFQGTNGSIRQAARKQENVLWHGGKMKDEVGKAKLCSPIAATAWEQKTGYRQPTVRVYSLNYDNCIQERTWDPSGWGDGALGGLRIRAAPSSQLAVTSWNEGNIMLCYQADDRTIRILNGWAQEGRWKRGSTLQRAVANSPLTVFNFEHYGNRGIRLYFKNENSFFEEACWDHVGDEAREDSSYFPGGYTIPASGRPSISAIAWMEEELEIRVYVGTGKRLFERRYSGVWVPFEKSFEENAEEAHISALRWGPGFSSVFSVGRDGLVEIVRADGSWTRTHILSKSVCSGADCPSHQQSLQPSVPAPPLQHLPTKFPASPHEQVQTLKPESQELNPQESESTPMTHNRQEHALNHPSLVRRVLTFFECCC